MLSHSLPLSGITITPSEDSFIGELGSTVTFNCSSDLFPLRIEWHKNGSFLSFMNGGYATLMVVISTDDHKAEYTCKDVSYLDSQEKSFTINVKGDVEQECPNFSCVLCRATYIPFL